MPRCYRCGEEKPADQFAVDRSKASGRKSICKPCDKAKGLAYYRRNRDRMLERAKARYRRRKKAGSA
jgi:hypothetical protein